MRRKKHDLTQQNYRYVSVYSSGSTGMFLHAQEHFIVMRKGFSEGSFQLGIFETVWGFLTKKYLSVINKLEKVYLCS